ncbi:IS1 family transposase [Candidatus Williamhamiltonella defendens]|uniref:IS1 family transposase n=1 Tax=Candidatus Williamhamiltonella defendens TaxID=138072 RepID=UPI001650F2C0
MPDEKHRVGKIHTRLLPEKFSLRIRLTRSHCAQNIGYSKSTELHENIIVTCIERNYYF